MWPFKFPYTNFHELNLDWVLGTVKSNEERISANELKIRLLGGDDPLNALHPVGSLFFSAEEESPAALFGGVWEQLKDRFLLGAGGGYSSGSTGGEATHKLTEAELPPVGIYDANNANRRFRFLDGIVQSATTAGWAGGITSSNSATSYVVTGGGDQPHNNMPPYLAVYMWKRIS